MWCVGRILGRLGDLQTLIPMLIVLYVNCQRLNGNVPTHKVCLQLLVIHAQPVLTYSSTSDGPIACGVIRGDLHPHRLIAPIESRFTFARDIKILEVIAQIIEVN